MKIKRSVIAFALGLGMCHIGLAQVSAGAPAGTTGQCKDGSYSNAAKKAGACRGHQGVQKWFAADTSASVTSAKTTKSTTAAPAPAAVAPSPTPAARVATPAPVASPSKPSAAFPASAIQKGPVAMAASRPQASGGGPGMVWVNMASKVYHCPGATFYGKTKDGKYMSESDAKAMGARPDHNKPCSN
jgi:hypothetical protein